MSEITLNKINIPKWLINSDLYKELDEDTDFKIKESKYVESSKIKDEADFIKVLKVANYWGAELPKSVDNFILTCKNKVIDILFENSNLSNAKMLLDELLNSDYNITYKITVDEGYRTNINFELKIFNRKNKIYEIKFTWDDFENSIFNYLIDKIILNEKFIEILENKSEEYVSWIDGIFIEYKPLNDEEGYEQYHDKEGILIVGFFENYDEEEFVNFDKYKISSFEIPITKWNKDEICNTFEEINAEYKKIYDSYADFKI